MARYPHGRFRLHLHLHLRLRILDVLMLALVLAIVALPPTCLARAIEAREINLPAPISVAPDQDWVGIDGSWNTISLRAGGDPSQISKVFVSTASQQTWLVADSACSHNVTNNSTRQVTLQTDSSCYDSRGRTFNTSASSTWRPNGYYQLWLEKNMGINGNGLYGWDTIGLGGKGEETATLSNTTIGTIITPNFWLGHFGINPKPTNFSAFTDPSPSYLSMLFEQKLIPSLSWGYTAGNQYHASIVLSSLTLGGFDSARIIPNDISFAMAPDNERDLVVGIVGITANGATKSNVNLLAQDSFTMYIDSTLAELWLPISVCQAFESTFGLVYDETTGLYLVNDDLHYKLLTENPSITFSLGQKFTTNSTVDITLPYDAFDLQAKPPYAQLNTTSNYFPIRRAKDESNFVLGRTFLQEAYLHVDWERWNFSVSAIDWSYKPKNIVPYYSPNYTENALTLTRNNGSSLGTGAKIGLGVGMGLGMATVGFGVLWWFWRRRHQRKLQNIKDAYEAQARALAEKKGSNAESEKRSGTPAGDPEDSSNVIPKAELPAEYKDLSPTTPTTFGGPSPIVEADNSERQIYEMPGDMPSFVEAGGRQLSEKETMIVREARINGTDPHGPPEYTPTISEATPQRPPPLVMSDIAMVNRRMPISPVTPRTPRDGSDLEAHDTFFQRPPQAHSPRDGRYLEAEDSLLLPISPTEGSDGSRRRFSYEA